MSRSIIVWVCLPHIIPFCLDHHVQMILLWHKNMWSFWSCFLIFNHPPILLQVLHMILLNMEIPVILWLMVIICLHNVLDSLYYLLPPRPKDFFVYWNDYISNILQLIVKHKFLLCQSGLIIIRDRLLANPYQKFTIYILVIRSPSISKSPSSHTISFLGFLCNSIALFSLIQFYTFQHKVPFSLLIVPLHLDPHFT